MQTLKEYAELNNLTYHTAREHALKGKITNARRDEKGKIFIYTDEELNSTENLKPVTEIRRINSKQSSKLNNRTNSKETDKAAVILNNLAPALKMALAQNYPATQNPCKISIYTKNNKLHFNGYIDMEFVQDKSI